MGGSMDLEEHSIAELRGMLAAVPPDSDDAAGLTEELAAALVGRYESGALPADAAGADLDEAIALTTGLLARHDDADGALGAHLIQAAAHYYRAGAGDEPAELDAAISRLEAVAGRLDDEELAPDVLVMLGDCLTARYRNALPGAPLEETDLSAAIDAYERASRLAAEDDPAMITVAYELAGLHQQRYLARAARGHSGARADLDEAIGCFRRVLAAVAAGPPADSGSGEDERAFYEQLAEEVTVRLGLALADRVLQHGNAPADVDEAIARLEAVVPPAGDPFRPLAAVYRGVMLGVRFTMHRGDPADRGTAITVLREALAGADSPDRGQVEGDAGYVDPNLADTARLWLGQLLILGDVPAELRAGVPPAAFDLRQAARIGSRMAATATRDEADEAIGQLSRITTLPGTGDEGEATIAMLLGTALVIRGATGMPDGDLDRIIGLFGRAAQLTRPDALGGPELTAMHAWLLGERANRPGRTDDIEPAAEALTRARALLPASHPMTPFVLYYFAATVGRRGMHRSYAPDVTAAIEALSEALVAMPDDHPMRTQALSLLGAAMLSGAQFDLTALPLGRLIEVLGQALERPDADPVSRAVRLCCLGQATHLQAIRSRAQDGVTRAVDYVKQADGLLPADHSLRAFVLFTLATMLADQYSFTSALESLTASAYYLDRMEEVLESSNAPAYDPDGNSFASVYATRGSVRMMLAHRHEDALLFRQAIADLERALSLYPANHPMRPRMESELATATMGLAILERDPRRLAEGLAGLAAPAETVTVDHPDFASLHGRAGLMLVSQAWMTGDGRALDDGVVSLRKAVAYAGLGEGERARLRWGLGFALAHRYDLSRDVADLDQGIEELEQARRELVRGPGDGAAIHVLAQLAHAYRKRADPARGDLRQATETGLAALREQASGVLLQTGTERALMMARVAAADAAEVASWALDDGRPEAAVEALELGRALVLHAATAAVDLPALLRESGFPALAAEWESRNAATAQAEGEASPATPWDQAAGAAGREARSIEARSAEALLAELPGVTPDDLRHRTLQALAGGPAQARLLSPPGLGEIRDAMTVTGTDLIAYLIPAGEYGPGRAVVVGGGAVTEIPLRALACGPGSPAERYAAAQQEANRDRRAENNTNERAASTLARLCDWAWAAAVGPLLDAVANPDPHLVLIPLGLLGVVPWHAARWYDQAGAPHYAVEQATFSYAASARQFADLARREPLTDPARAVLVGVASDQTPFMNIEASEIRDSFYPEGLLLRAREPARATAERVLGWLPGRDAEGASLLHLSCHAMTGASPDRSYLQLAGGDELRIDRILRRAHGRPAGAPGGLVILAACASDLTAGFIDHDGQRVVHAHAHDHGGD